MLSRRVVISGLALAPFAGPAAAQDWPARPVRVVVPWTPGSAADTVARVIAEQLASELGQPFVVENRPGAGGTLGVAAVAKAAPDGYTILVHTSTHVVSASTYSTLPYDPRKDLAGVSGLVNLPNVLVVAANKGYDNVKALVAAGKAKEGALNFATGGAGSGSHLTAERFMAAAGFKAQHVPFKGGPEALNEIVAGRVDFYFVPLPPARGLIASGKVGVIAVSNSQRASALPNIPTTVEAGFPNSEYNFWAGLFAPAGTPKAIVDRLNAATVKALASAAAKDRLKKIGADPLPMSPAEFHAFVLKEIDVNAAIVKATGVKIN
jgi:tripartite-type tricarboxylate transporter receptor subunit TctC